MNLKATSLEVYDEYGNHQPDLLEMDILNEGGLSEGMVNMVFAREIVEEIVLRINNFKPSAFELPPSMESIKIKMRKKR